MLGVILDTLLRLLEYGLFILMLCLLVAVLLWVLLSWVKHSCFRHDYPPAMFLGMTETQTVTCRKCGKSKVVHRGKPAHVEKL